MSIGRSLEGVGLRVHDAIYRATGGRVGHRLIGVPSLMLTTTGRLSRRPRTVSLIYARDGDGYVVVASNAGLDRPPAWLRNIRADPSVAVQVATLRAAARARVVERGAPDFDRLWALANANNHGRYERYQGRTSRPIAVVVLSLERPLA
jgi:deazaflavin-dependent oxidoreductase (nitroreductase family)